MLHAEQQGTRIIGIAGMQTRVGTSTLARLLARAYTDHGKSTLLVDASAAGAGAATSAPAAPRARSELMQLARDDRGLMVLNLAEHANLRAALHDAMRLMFDSVADAMTVVVDLPPVDAATGAFRSGYSGAASACDLVYLVCQSGKTRRVDLANCIEICRVNGLKIGGIVANDWKVLGSRYLESHSPLGNESQISDGTASL